MDTGGTSGAHTCSGRYSQYSCELLQEIASYQHIVPAYSAQVPWLASLPGMCDPCGSFCFIVNIPSKAMFDIMLSAFSMLQRTLQPALPLLLYSLISPS